MESPDPAQIRSSLGLLARYYYFESGCQKEDIMEKLDAFMERHYPRYHPVDWSLSIEKHAARAAKYPLCQCPGIWVTQQELQTISDINHKVLERLAFTLLCLARFKNFRNENNHDWVNDSNAEIYKLACINTTAFEKDLKLSQLRDMGLIEFAKKVDNPSIHVLFLHKESEPVLFIRDFRKLGLEWRLYKGEPYIRCANCGILIKKTSNSKKYCPECAQLSAAQKKYHWDLQHKQRRH